MVYKQLIDNYHIMGSVTSALITAVISLIINKISRGRIKVVAFSERPCSHELPNHNLPDKPFILNTHVLSIINTGQLSANNIIINHTPICSHSTHMFNYKIFPITDYTETVLSDSSKQVCIEKLRPKEHITISYIYSPAITANMVCSNIKHDDGLVDFINVMPTKHYPKWVQWLLRAILFIGSTTIIYWLITIFLLVYSYNMK